VLEVSSEKEFFRKLSPSPMERDIIHTAESLFNAKRIAIISGAGISVSAGIPVCTT
jgi:carbamate kinase